MCEQINGKFRPIIAPLGRECHFHFVKGTSIRQSERLRETFEGAPRPKETEFMVYRASVLLVACKLSFIGYFSDSEGM